jgi:hypothetical protein
LGCGDRFCFDSERDLGFAHERLDNYSSCTCSRIDEPWISERVDSFWDDLCCKIAGIYQRSFEC